MPMSILILAGYVGVLLYIFRCLTKAPKAIKVIGACPVCGTKVWSGWKRCVRCRSPIAQKASHLIFQCL